MSSFEEDYQHQNDEGKNVFVEDKTSKQEESPTRVEETDVPFYDTDSDNQTFSFGDFTTADCDKYFIKDAVPQISVEFICDFYNTSKAWVEDCSKQEFVDVDGLVIECNLQNENTETKSQDKNEKPKNDVNKEEGKTELDLADEKHDSSKSSVEIKPSSWASLFKNGSSLNDHTNNNNKNNKNKQIAEIFSVQMEEVAIKNNVGSQAKNNPLSLIDIEKDERAIALGEFMTNLSPNSTRHHLQLRGLINRGNWCYINTVLQALHGISPLSHFYKSLKKFVNRKRSTSTPVTDSMISFFNEFEPINPKIPLRKQSEDLRAGAPFEPRCVYDVLPVMKSALSEKGRQEDAEEFLSFLLNGMHDELATLLKLGYEHAPVVNESKAINNNEIESDCEEESSWEHVGRNNKSSMLRKAVIAESFIKDLFGGVIRSSVHQTGVKESTTLQPFFTLQLDIQSDKIYSLTDAIECCFMKESLQGFTCSKTNTEVEASRRTSLEELPTIFIFHLKYFVFNLHGSQKLHKHIEIPVDLEIPKEVLSPNLRSKSTNMRYYKLYAVVYHHGKNSAGGHYTAAVHHGNPFGWVNFDDNIIKTVNVSQVLKHQQACVPYLLFYERIQTR